MRAKLRWTWTNESGPGRNKLSRSCPGSGVTNLLTFRSVSTTMTIIYVVSGFVGVLLVAVMGRGFCVMRNRLREEAEEEDEGFE